MKSILFLFLLLIPSLLYTQNNYSQIIEVYGNEWVDNQISTNNEELLVFLSNYSQKGIIVEEVDEFKFNDANSLEWIPLTSKQQDSISVNQFMSEFQSESFNPLKYQFLPQKEEQLFKLKGVNYIIRIKNQGFILN
jgi:hypothetical protein